MSLTRTMGVSCCQKARGTETGAEEQGIMQKTTGRIQFQAMEDCGRR